MVFARVFLVFFVVERFWFTFGFSHVFMWIRVARIVVFMREVFVFTVAYFLGGETLNCFLVGFPTKNEKNMFF